MSELVDMKVRGLELGLKKYTRGPLAAHMLATVVDACDSNWERFEALTINDVPPAVARRLLQESGYTRSDDPCTDCNRPVTQRDAVVINFPMRTVQHARCPEAS